MMLRLAEVYGRHGHNQIVCLRKDGWLAEQVRQRGYKLLIRPLGRSPDVRWIFWLASRMRALSVNAVHAHEFAMNFHATAAARLIGLPAVATFHGRAYYAETRMRRAISRLTSHTASVVAVSEDIRRHLCEAAGLAGHRVHFIPNGVDVDRFRFDPEARERERAALGVSGQQFLIGAVGSYYPVKGHSHLIKALRLVVDAASDVQLVIAGQGPLAAELQQQVDAMNLTRNVRLLGYVADPAALLSALDAFVMPSLSEGRPLALLEAAANGRPIVASSVGGIPELVDHETTGLLVPPADPRELAEALGRLMANADLRGRLGANAARTIREKWSIELTASHYLRLLLGNGRC